MKPHKLTHTLTAALLSMAFVSSAHAAPILDFETSYDDSDVTINSIDGWHWGDLSVDLSDDLYGNQFALAEGESNTFDFFNISLPKGVGSAELEATLAFLEPENSSGTGQGDGWWISGMLSSAGELTWNQQPGSVYLDDGSSFSIAFSDLEGIGLGTTHTVEATVTANAVAVPEPGTLALLGLGIGGLAAARRRHSRKTA